MANLIGAVDPMVNTLLTDPASVFEMEPMTLGGTSEVSPDSQSVVKERKVELCA